MQKRIIFLAKSEKTPSSRIRICDLIPYLEEKELEVTIEFIPKSIFLRHKLFQKCAEFDMVVLQKRLFSWFEFCELRKNAAKLTFDFDDAVYFKNKSPSTNPADYISKTRERRFKRIIKAADLVIAANSVLAESAEKYTKKSKIAIIPSSVNLKNIVSKKEFKLSSPPIIGWVGSKVTQRYLDYLAPKLCEFRKKQEFILKIISDKEYKFEGLATENAQWSLETENCEINKFDIGIMPLSDDPFSQGKASYKLLQYMAAGIPSIASTVGMNKDVADNEKNALLANTPDEFIEKIILLLQNCELRKQLGHNGRELIEQKFSRDVVGANFAETISAIF